MKTPTLDQQFLFSLNPDQKGQVWNYYLLITNPDMEPDQQIAQISEIWSHAENDERLMEWLEFIDYFYTDVDETDLPDAAKRAYLSEYLIEMVAPPPNQDDFYGPMRLECPKGRGQVVIPGGMRAAYGSVRFQQQRCSNCGYEYEQHTPVDQQQTSLPEA